MISWEEEQMLTEQAKLAHHIGVQWKRFFVARDNAIEALDEMAKAYGEAERKDFVWLNFINPVDRLKQNVKQLREMRSPVLNRFEYKIWLAALWRKPESGNALGMLPGYDGEDHDLEQDGASDAESEAAQV